MKKMLSPRKKEGGGSSAATSVVSVANSVTTRVEDVDGDISGDESNSHATSISNNGSLR